MSLNKLLQKNLAEVFAFHETAMTNIIQTLINEKSPTDEVVSLKLKALYRKNVAMIKTINTVNLIEVFFRFIFFIECLLFNILEYIGASNLEDLCPYQSGECHNCNWNGTHEYHFP